MIFFILWLLHATPLSALFMLKVLIQILILTKITLLSPLWADNNSLLIKLCLNETKPKYREQLKDFVELQLLLIPEIQTLDCDNRQTTMRTYSFRQQITEINDMAKSKRAQIISTLYHYDGRAIFSQVEFVERSSRKTMNERAKLLATAIRRAIVNNQTAFDPFMLLPTGH